MDEGKPCLDGCFLVLAGIADIDPFAVVVAIHDQTDVFSFGEAGALPFLIVNKQIGGAGGGKERIHIAPLAVTDNGQVISFRAKGFHGGTEIRIKGAAVGMEIFHFINTADIEDFIPAGNTDIRIERLADFLHGHAHDAVNILLCEKGQAGAFTLEDFIPGFRYGPGRIPQGAVEVKNQ